MYINLKLLESKNLSTFEAMTLQLAKQNKNEPVESHFVEIIVNRLIEEEFIHLIKGKKKDHWRTKIRLTKKGNRVLEDIQIAEVEEEDLILYEWIKERYKEEDKQIGNMKQSKINLANLRAQTGISKNKLAFLIQSFVNDVGEQAYSHRLEYVFWKAQNVFQTKFSLDQCRLYQYYLKHQEFFDRSFEKIGE